MKNLFFILICVLVSGCGVRGDPLPPELPAELGRGRPNYKRASEGLKLEDSNFDEDDEQETPKALPEEEF